MKLKALVIAACSLSMVSCGAIDKAKKRAKKAKHSNPAMLGTWDTDCRENSVLELTHGQKEYIFDLEGKFTKKEYLFDNEGCENKAAVYEVDGDYKDLGENKENHEVKNIDFKITEAHLTIYSDAAVKAMNAVKFCGINTWEKGEKKDLLGQECSGYLVPNNGDMVYDVYDVSDDTLTFGGNFLFLSDKDPSQRPTKTDQDLVYNKTKD
ncbi:MAG: hypothetical protein AB7T49_14360 [Oligoflexales bacterium]